MHTQHDRKPGLFEEFRPPTGEFPRVALTEPLRDEIVRHLRAYVARSGWRYQMQRAAYFVIEEIGAVGVRFELLCSVLADRLGLSKSMGSYYLRRLREVGFLDLYRQHHIDWKKTELLRTALDQEELFCAAPSVHELSLRRWGRVFRSRPGSGDDGVPMNEKRALSWGSVMRRLGVKSGEGRSPAMGPPTTAA